MGVLGLAVAGDVGTTRVNPSFSIDQEHSFYALGRPCVSELLKRSVPGAARSTGLTFRVPTSLATGQGREHIRKSVGAHYSGSRPSARPPAARFPPVRPLPARASARPSRPSEQPARNRSRQRIDRKPSGTGVARDSESPHLFSQRTDKKPSETGVDSALS